jgi:uncharacterized membrane protein
MTSLQLPSPLRRRWFFLRSETDRVLTLSMLFSCLLVAARIYHTGKLTFVFMPWNLFLAYVPYFISTSLTRVSPAGSPTRLGTRADHLLRITGLIAWLLFIPNSFYILTDLYHLADNHRNIRVPEWFDLILILSFAWNGLLLGIYSTRQVEKLLAPNASFLGRWVFLYPIMWLNALGVFIGRYLRYNSWDIFTNPLDLLRDIITLIAHPLRHHDAWSMIFCYSILLTLIYSLFTKNNEPWKI